MKVRNLLSGFLAAIITVLLVVSLADGYAYYDKEAPKVVYTDPQHEAKNVDPQVIGQTGIRIRFGEPVVVSHAAVTVDGLDLGWMLVDSGDPYEALLKKGKKNLPHDAKIDVKYCVQDYAGNQNKGTFSFTTKPDTEPLFIVSSYPRDGDKDVALEYLVQQGIWVRFNKPIVIPWATLTITNPDTGESRSSECDCYLALDRKRVSVARHLRLEDFEVPEGVMVYLAVGARGEAENENESEFTITFRVVIRKDDDNEDEE